MLVDTHCHIQSIGMASGERSTRELWAKSDLNVSQVLQNAQRGWRDQNDLREVRLCGQ